MEVLIFDTYTEARFTLIPNRHNANLDISYFPNFGDCKI